jgi:membrane fusion protein (multidrug efflux system)
MNRIFVSNKQVVGTSLLMILALSLSCSNKQNTTPPPVEVSVVEVLKEDVDIKHEFVGQTFGYKDISIRARVDGFLEELHFQEGTQVKKGQLLYTIDSQPYEAKVAEALGKLAEAKTRMVQAKNDLERYIPLAEINAVSKKDLDAAEANYGAAKAAVEAAEAFLRSSRIELSYTKIYSPIDGFIGKTEAKQGDYVGKSPNPVVLNAVSDVDPILVQFSIAERGYLELMRFNKARRAAKTAPEEQSRELELLLADNSIHDQLGKIDFIDRQIDPTTGTILLQASFPNPDRILRPGQFAKVRASVEIVKDADLIPQRSVQELQGKFLVYVVNDSNQVKVTEVELGERVRDMVIVEKGLPENATIILEGLQKVREGAVVTPVMAELSPEIN